MVHASIRGVFAAAIVSALAGCAGMSEQACLVTDWRTLGFEDGAAGRPVTQIGRYRESCARHGVAPDLAAYRGGHADGTEIYCRPGNGFEQGRRGASYRGVCAADVEPEFLAAFNSGARLYELEAAVAGVDRQIAANAAEQSRIKREITEIGITMVAEDTSAEERIRLVARTAELGERYGALTEETEALERERVGHAAALRDYEETLAYGF